MTPTARSLDFLRKQGYCVCSVERWSPAGPAGFKGPLIRKDAFGFGDLLACKVGIPGALLVQVTTAGNINARIKKIKSIAEAGVWLASGNRIQVAGWSKMGAAGKRKLWHCRVVDVGLEMDKSEKAHPIKVVLPTCENCGQPDVIRGQCMRCGHTQGRIG